MIASRGFCARGRNFVHFASGFRIAAAAQSSQFTGRLVIPTLATTSSQNVLLPAGQVSSVILRSSGKLQRDEVHLASRFNKCFSPPSQTCDALTGSALEQPQTLDPG